MYRLGFCHGYAGDASTQADWMQKAVTKLTEESAAADNLEVSFFLANAQTNVGRPDDAKKTAAAATGRIERKAWPAPRTGLEKFRVAKLYADQGRTDQAVSWYREAVRSFESEKVEAPGYVRWAQRYLAQDAFAKSDFVEAEKRYAALTSAGGASAADFDRLATASARVGKYQAAATAWNDAVRLDPANADRARYSRNLALLAQGASGPPGRASGGAWGQLTKEDLRPCSRNRPRRPEIYADRSTRPRRRARSGADVEQKPDRRGDLRRRRARDSCATSTSGRPHSSAARHDLPRGRMAPASRGGPRRASELIDDP
jgi:tetratricopeptide (TPR) repeat protein